MNIELSFNLQSEIKKREYREQLQDKLHHIDINSNLYDVAESAVSYAENFFKGDYKHLKKESVQEFLVPFVKDIKTLDKMIESIVRRLFPKLKGFQKLASWFRKAIS